MSGIPEKVLIESLAYGGEGIGKIDGRVVFVPGAFPGDEVMIRIVQDKGSYLRGSIDEIIGFSESRTESFCKYAGICGGCQWQELKYDEQLVWKQKIVSESFRRIGSLPVERIEPCLPSPIVKGFRSSVRLMTEERNGNVVFGFRARRTNDIVGIDLCPAATDSVNEILGNIRNCIRNEKNIKEIVIAASVNKKSSVITIKTDTGKSIGRFAEKLLSIMGDSSGLVHRSLENRLYAVYGKDYREETVGSGYFRVNESSFFQTNVRQAENMVKIAGEMTEFVSGGRLVDGFGGVGLFSFAAVSPDWNIHLYDMSETAVDDSIFNSECNKYKNFHAYRLETTGAVKKIGSADTVIIDPPRPGLGEKAVNSVTELKASSVIYISCNPTTLARDIKYFSKNGYVPEKVIPLDMFPHTFHIECITLLKKKF